MTTYLDELYRAEDDCRAQLAAAEAALLVAEAGIPDLPALDRLSAAIDNARDELAGILDEIEEIEEGDALAGARQDRADYHGRVL